MTTMVKITNDLPEGAEQRLKVTVVKVGDLDAPEQRHLLAAQESITVHVHGQQFVMVDETEKEG